MKKFKFKAQIEPGMGGGAGIVFPYDVQQEFGTRGNVPVKATIDGVPYTGSLMNCGAIGHTLGVLKSVRRQIGKGPGEVVEVVVWKDEEVRTVAVPAAFQRLLKKEGLLADFEKLSYTHRKEYCRWIAEAKKEETRLNRIGKAIEMLRQKIRTPG
ncbi:MAG: YdeI/OmpD-associated family protein [Terracidiphilus sp.]